MGRGGMGRDGPPSPAPPLAPRSILWKLLGMSKYSYEAELCSSGSPQSILVPRLWGWGHPVLHPQNISFALWTGDLHLQLRGYS